MGKDYEAAVLTTGFVGFAPGTASNSIANMETLSKRYGPPDPRSLSLIAASHCAIMLSGFKIDCTFTNGEMPMKQDLEDALQAIVSMIGRAEKAQEQFLQGTSQYTLQKNRIKSLYIALSLIKSELERTDVAVSYTTKDLEEALAPIASLMSKSEKVQKKLTQGTWQYTMTENHLKALHIALPLLQKALGSP